MAVTPITGSWDVRAPGAHAGGDSLMKQCHYCYKWGYVKSSCYRLLKVCFACHRPGHLCSKLCVEIVATNPFCWCVFSQTTKILG